MGPFGPPRIVRKIVSPGTSNFKQALTMEARNFPEDLLVNVSLAPDATSGYRVCPFSTPGCGGGKCVGKAGLGNVGEVHLARIARTRLLFQQPAEFQARLLRELRVHHEAARRAGRTLRIRLNCFSDLLWERTHPELFEEFADGSFYDYSKVFARLGNVPTHYDLTFSRSESNGDDCRRAIEMGVNVAVVFGTPKGHVLPKTFSGHEVIDGDIHDARYRDPRAVGRHGLVVGLRYKGIRTLDDETGFVISDQRDIVWLGDGPCPQEF